MHRFGILVRLFFGFALLFPGSGVGAQSLEKGAEPVKIPLQWEASEGAGSYKVEIQDQSGHQVFMVVTKKTSAEASLVPGIYQVRITSLNRFGTADAQADWSKLVVEKLKVPAIDKLAPGRVPASSAFKLTIWGSNLDKQTKWSLNLVGSKTAIAALGPPAAVKDAWELSFPALEAGSYDLVAVSKRGKEGRLEKAVTVEVPAKKTEVLPFNSSFWLGAGLTYAWLFPTMPDWSQKVFVPDLSFGWNIVKTPGFRWGLEGSLGWLGASLHGQKLDQVTLTASAWIGWAWFIPQWQDVVMLSLPVGWEFSSAGLAEGRTGAPTARLALTCGLGQWGAVEVDVGAFEMGVPSFSYIDQSTLTQVKAGAFPFIAMPRAAYLWRF